MSDVSRKDARQPPCCWRQRAWRLRYSRQINPRRPSGVFQPPCSLRRGRAGEVRAGSIPFAPSYSPPPSKRGRAERRTHDASAASCAVKTSARVSHHESTGHIRRSARSGFFGLLRALPGNALGLTPSSPRYVTCARSGTGRGGPDSVRDHTTWADAQRRCTWGESPPRSASRSVVRQPMVCASRFAGVRTHPLYKECASPRACALNTHRRPDAAASTASRPATSDDREPPLVE